MRSVPRALASGRSLTVAVLLALIAIAGCPQAPKPDEKPDEKPAPVVVSGITGEIRAARTQSTAIYRERLTAIAGDVRAGRIVYDTKLQLELNQASRDAGKPIADVMAKHMPTGKLTDAEGTATKIEQIRDGYE